MKLVIKNLSFCYQKNKKNNDNLFNQFNFTFQQNNLYSLTGDNGTGKTTLLDIIAGFKKADSGSLSFFDSAQKEKTPQIDDIIYFTQFYENLFFTNNVKDEISQTIKLSKSSLSYKDIENYYKLLGLNLSNIEFYSPFELNSGSQKILSLMLALIKNSPIMLLDEIESSLSFDLKLNLISFLKEMKKGKIIICVSHDNMFINKTADKVIMLKKKDDRNNFHYRIFESAAEYFKSDEFSSISSEKLKIEINKDHYLNLTKE